MIFNSADIFHPRNAPEFYFIKNIWRLYEFNSEAKYETILPKGNIEIIFNFSEDIVYKNELENKKFQLPICFINGLNFKPFTLVKNGQQKFLGIQLNSLGVKVLFDHSIKELHNKVIEGNEVCKSLMILSQKLAYISDFNDQVTLIMIWVKDRITHFKELNSLNRIYELFYSKGLNSNSVSSFKDEACMCDRQLRRLSLEWFGMSTRSFLQYKRYLHSLKLLHETHLPLTEVGLESGYYDQSHFIREFKTFTALNPNEYKHSSKGMLGHIYT